MGYIPPPAPHPYPDTRHFFRYDRHFAIFPVRCHEDRWVWLDTYYTKTLVFEYKEIDDVCYKIYSLTKADAIVEKLTDNIDFR